MSKEVQFSIKLLVDGKEKVVNATASVSDMQRAVEATRTHMDKLRDSLVTFNQKVDKIRNVSSAISDIATAATEASSKIRGMQASLAQAAQLTGLQGDELKAVRSRAQAVADVFDGDVSEVMQAANSLAKSFGTSVTDAMQLLQDGMVSGANANGEFIDTLREYPRYFKEAGISAEEFVAITTNAAKQGIFSDKGVDAIKEGNLRIREMTEATANALEGIADAWTTITSVVDGALQMYQGISGIIGIINKLTGASEATTIAETGKAAATIASTTAQTAETGVAEAGAAAQVPVIAANKLAATSFMELAAAEYMAAHAYIPFAGYGIAAGFVVAANALVLAQQAIPFADGGIVSGPTYALVGEYAGASHNPEVIAPLDKLSQMIQPRAANAGGRVEFRIRGKNLVGAMANQTRISSASGKRTNIKI